MQDSRYGPLIESVTAWASEETEVRAAMVVGSQARSTSPADEWSDLDLALFVKDPGKLLGSDRWVDRFGSVVLTFVEATAVGSSQERRVLYSNGLDVDFAVFPAAAIHGLVQAGDALETLRRGYRILLDKDGTLGLIPSALSSLPPRTDSQPRPAEFGEVVGEFWYHVLWTARKVRRGEIWAAKAGCDSRLKRLLLRVLQWRVLLESGGRTDVWHDGRFIDEWAPADVKNRLAASFAEYSLPDVVRALRETSDLFADQARRVAAISRIPYPEEIESKVRALTDHVLKGLDSSI